MNTAALACVMAAVSYGAGAVLQSFGARQSEASGFGGLVSMMRQRWYLCGLACDLMAWLLTTYAVKHLPLFAVHSTLAGSVAVTVVLARLFLRAPLRRIDGAAVAMVLVGLVLVGVAAEAAAEGGGGSTARTVLALGLLPAGLVAVSAARSNQPIFAAMIAGLLFSSGAAAVRTLDLAHGPLGLLAQPTAWAVPTYLGTGLFVHARALQTGSVGAVTAALWATEVVVASITGYLLFDDRVRPGTLPWAILGMAVALGATAHLARVPTLSPDI
jgi:drug/metabolite transporter (DMT)-like permease